MIHISDLHLHESAEREERDESQNEKRHLPAVDECDDHGRSHVGDGLQEGASATAGAQSSLSGVVGKAGAKNASAMLWVVKETDFL